MITEKYSINNIFKLTLIINIIFSTANSVLANVDASKTPEESSTGNPELPINGGNSGSEKGSVPKKTTKEEPNSNNKVGAEASEAKEQSESNNTEITTSQEFLNLKNILLLFAIIDLPILALLLTLWFLDRKEQKQKLNRLANNQNTIDRKLKQLDKITLKLEESDNSQNKIIKRIEENRQEIINSRIELLSAFDKKQSERLNSDGNINVASNNYNSFPTFIEEPTEHQLDKHSHNQVAVIEQIPQFVSKYNLDKNSLSDEVKATVAATEANLNERRLGKSDILTLEHTNLKKYWIVQENSDYYLVPHAKINIEEHNIKTLESLFECINFYSDYKDFHLIEPAKVSQLESELWQLEKKGKLEFF